MEIEEILQNFSLEKVRKAERYCKGAYSLEDMKEQIYRAHYSSFKIQRSWQEAKSAMFGIAYLLGYVDEKNLEKIKNMDIDNIMKKIFDKSIEDIFSHMKKEKFFGEIPLITGIYALGAKAIFCQYLNSVCNILEKLHKNKRYRKGIDKKIIDWEEAMLLKTFVYLKRK